MHRSMDETKLKIPLEFLRKVVSQIFEFACVHIKVHVKRANNECRLCNGMPLFVNFYPQFYSTNRNSFGFEELLCPLFALGNDYTTYTRNLSFIQIDVVKTGSSLIAATATIHNVIFILDGKVEHSSRNSYAVHTQK